MVQSPLAVRRTQQGAAGPTIQVKLPHSQVVGPIIGEEEQPISTRPIAWPESPATILKRLLTVVGQAPQLGAGRLHHPDVRATVLHLDVGDE